MTPTPDDVAVCPADGDGELLAGAPCAEPWDDDPGEDEAVAELLADDPDDPDDPADVDDVDQADGGAGAGAGGQAS